MPNAAPHPGLGSPAGPARPSLSLELFPPRPGRYASQTWGALDRLLAAGPDFVSVTYRPRFITTAGGPAAAPLIPASSRIPSRGGIAPAAPPVSIPSAGAAVDGAEPEPAHEPVGPTGPTRVHVVREHNPSEDVVAHVLARSSIPLMAHLTCIGYKKANVVEIVRLFLGMGVRRFLALRGDPPRGVRADDVVGEIRHADELVRVIREVEAEYFDDGERHVQIAVAAYPAAIDHGREVEVLAAKQAAGADLAITQVFYDAEDYCALARAASYSGVVMPVLPGVIPMTDLRRLTRLEALSGVRVPAGLRSALERAEGAAAVTAGIDATLRLATELIDGGAPGLHLYTFNRTRPALDVISQLRLGSILDGAPADRRTQTEVRRAYLNAVPGTSPRVTGRMPQAARS